MGPPPDRPQAAPRPPRECRRQNTLKRQYPKTAPTGAHDARIRGEILHSAFFLAAFPQATTKPSASRHLATSGLPTCVPQAPPKLPTSHPQAPLKPHQCDIKAPTRRVGSHPVGTPKPPPGYPKAPIRLPQGCLKATPKCFDGLLPRIQAVDGAAELLLDGALLLGFEDFAAA